MKILVNEKIKRLFVLVLLSMAVFTLLSAAFAAWKPENAAWCIMVFCVIMELLILAAMYLYFRDQSQTIEHAIAQIKAYISGNYKARISCDCEGELYRLFHEINSLASILNAHAENEKRAKGFLKDTISDISHQLKTPLAALNVYNGIMQEEAEDAPAVREFADLSEKELDRIDTLVQSLLKITKLDAGTMVLEKTEEKVSEMMRQLEGHFAYQARQEGKLLSFLGSDKVTLLCDGAWLEEAVGNILKNAFDHTGKGDAIRITWQKYASLVQIVVSDSGSGIHPEDLPHIFKRFYRSRFSKDTQGIGLGLSLAKAIVEAHNGTIEVDSVLGRGTTFTINFLIPTKL